MNEYKQKQFCIRIILTIYLYPWEMGSDVVKAWTSKTKAKTLFGIPRQDRDQDLVDQDQDQNQDLAVQDQDRDKISSTTNSIAW